MKRIWIFLFTGLVGGAMACASVWAQATGQISGSVRDQSGAVLPGVEVTATQTDTGIARNAVTNETGSYVLPNLAVGPYRLEAALPGFRTFVQTGIVLQVNSSPVINPTLEVGQVTEQVEVQANAALVETRSTAVGQVIENERILELPLQGRQVTDLITLSGAAVETGKSSPEGWNRGTTAGTFISIAGGPNFGVMYALDGAMHTNAYDGTAMPMPFPDALQEFKVDASGTGAAGGTRGSGGQVNAVTKSGTNELHGNAFEFVRHYVFNARNVFAAKRDTLKRNQFGGTLGGPIVKNKLFFFGGYQGTKTNTDPGESIGYVPTTAVMAGDWTTFASPACNARGQINLPTPFANNRISPALYNKVALNITAKLPPAQNDCGKVIYSLPQKPIEHQAVGKIDYQQTAKHSIFGRYMVTSYKAEHPYTLTGNLLAVSTNEGGNDNLAQTYAFGSTYLIGANMVNAFRVTVNRTRISRKATPFFSAPDVGVNAYSYTPGSMGVTITGGFSLGGRSYPNRIITDAYQVGDDLNLLHGNHQLTMGANLANWRTYQRDHTTDQGSYTFNGTATGLGMADFLTGRLTSLNQLTPVQWSSRQWYVASYLQDVWKATPKLTFNGGVRWEPYLPLAIGFGQGSKLNEGAMYHFSEDRFLKGIKSTVYPSAPAGLYYPGDPGYPDPGPNFKKWGLFAPRVGLAWDVQGDGRTSVRAAYGLAYDFSGSLSFGGSSSAPPWGFGTTVNSPAGGFEDPWRDYPGGNPFPYVRLSKWPTLSQYYFVQDLHAAEPMVQTWSLSIQRQLPASFLLTTSYLGNNATHMWVGGNINRAVFFPGSPVNGICRLGNFVLQTTGSTCSTTANTDQRRILFLQSPQEGQYYGNMATREDSGTSNYHGLLISVQRRAAAGVNIAGNYTWSHCIGDAATANATGRGGDGYLDPNNRAFDRGNCAAPSGGGNSTGSDTRHIFNMTAVASTPQFTGRTLRMLATGWQLSTIFRISTGKYFTVNTGLDRLLSGGASNQRPVQILQNPYLDKDSLNYLNPNAFAQPAFGTMGNMRPYNILGPGTWQLDLGLSRSFKPRENQRLEFRAEAFNVTNSFRVGCSGACPSGITDGISTTLNSNTFGQVMSAKDPRIMQFALKYSF